MNKKHSFTLALIASMLALPVSQAVQAQQVHVSSTCSSAVCSVNVMRNDGANFASDHQFLIRELAPSIFLGGGEFQVAFVNDRELLFNEQFSTINSGVETMRSLTAGSSLVTEEFDDDTRRLGVQLTIDDSITAGGSVTLAFRGGGSYTFVGDVNDENQVVFTRAEEDGAVGVFMPVVVDTAEVMRLQGELDMAEAALATAEAALADAPTQAEVMAAEEARDTALARVMQLETQLAAVGETPAETPTAGTPVAPAETPAAAAPTRRSSSNSGSGNAVAALVIVGGAWLLNRHNPNARLSAFALPTGQHSYGLHANWQQSDNLSVGFQHHESGLNVDSQQGKDAVNSRSVLTLKYTW